MTSGERERVGSGETAVTEEPEEANERVGRTPSGPQKSMGQCKVCGVDCEIEMRVPYCKTHAAMFAAFKQKQLAQLQQGHVE